MQSDKLTVDLGDRSYDIHVGEGLLERTGELLRHILPIPSVLIVTDKTVADLHLGTLQAALDKSDIKYQTVVLPAGEQTKSFKELEALLETLLAYKPERNTTLIAFGGGVIGDITGFAASILLRGVPFIQIPTTLLAMVDSSVGGKTGINTKYGKNLVGTFYQPKCVLADISLLKTLPKREFLAGYAEVVKYGFIQDATFFEELEKNASQLNNSAHLKHMIMTSCKAKADIVEKDEREGGIRALLNLGHTFAHALEAEMGYDGRLLHGEAVAIGLVLAFSFSVSRDLCPKKIMIGYGSTYLQLVYQQRLRK